MKQSQICFVFFSFFLFAVTSNFVFCQELNDDVKGLEFYKKGDLFLLGQQLDSSLIYFRKASTIYKKGKNWKGLAACFNKISENQRRDLKLDSALFYAEKSLAISIKHLSEISKESADAYDNIGMCYQKKSLFKKALPSHEKALKIREQLLPNHKSDQAITHENLGVFYINTSNYEKASYHLKKALQINTSYFGPEHQKTGIIHKIIGILYIYMGKHEQSIKHSKKFSDISIKNYGENHLYVGESFNSIGVAYIELGKQDDALYYYQKANKIFVNNNHLPLSGLSYNNLGNIYHNKGKYDKALKYYHKSLQIQLKLYPKNHPLIAGGYNNIGITLKNLGDYEEALKYYDKALTIRKSIYGEKSRFTADTYHNIGISYENKGEFDIALEYYHKALNIYTEIFGNKNHLKISDVYINIASVNYKKNKFDEALLNYSEVIKILEQNYGEENLISAKPLNQIGLIYSKLGHHKKAIEYHKKSLVANKKNKATNISYTSFSPDEYYDSLILLETLKGTAFSLWQKNRSSENSLDTFKKIFGIYHNLDQLIHHKRQSYLNYQDKVTFSHLTKGIYQDAVIVYNQAFETYKKLDYLKQAFYYNEQSKASALKELLNEDQAKNFVGLPKEALELEKVLKTDIAHYNSKVTNETSKKSIDSNKLREYQNNLFDLQLKQDSLIKVLEKNYTDYHRLKYNNDHLSITDIQRRLNKNTSILEFFTTDSSTYVFTITKQNIHSTKLSTPGIEKQIEQWKASILTKNIQEYKTIGHHLHNMLLAPVKEQLSGDELIVIPDGPLWHLNFDLLLTNQIASNDPKNFPYLLRQYAISYANSANILFTEYSKNSNTELLKECLAFSFSSEEKDSDNQAIALEVLRNTNDDLPGTREEILAISEILNGKYYYGSKAIETNFKQQVNRYNILHLALHGEVDNQHPENSKLYFTKSKDTLEDNVLYSHELFALNIPAELAVLSACNTGSGKIAAGEGIMSLGNAFQYAGTKSLLLSSWEVYDQTTPELMRHFYSNLKEGMNKPKALQKAKLEVLNASEITLSHPFYWGSFYLIGNPDPISFDTSYTSYWILGGILTFGLLCLGIGYYQRKTK